MATDPAEATSPPATDQPSRGSKYGFLFRPRWIGFHLLVVVLVVTMVNLAFWQIRRLDQRRHFNSEVRDHSNQPIVDYAELEDATATPATVEWRRVRVAGTYLADHEFLVVNRSQNGETGRNVVDALQLDDGSLLLVNRGFVPQADAVPPLPQGSVEVVGRLRASEHRGIGQEADDPSTALTEVRRIDVGVLSGQFDGSKLAPMYVEQLEATPPDANVLEPIAFPTLDEGPHLSYTIQWFIFSACTIVGWVLAVRRSIATHSGNPARKRRSSYVPIAEKDENGNDQ